MSIPQVILGKCLSFFCKLIVNDGTRQGYCTKDKYRIEKVFFDNPHRDHNLIATPWATHRYGSVVPVPILIMRKSLGYRRMGKTLLNKAIQTQIGKSTLLWTNVILRHCLRKFSRSCDYFPPIRHVPIITKIRQVSAPAGSYFLVTEQNYMEWYKLARTEEQNPASMSRDEWIELHFPNPDWDKIYNNEESYEKLRVIRKQWERAVQEEIAHGRISPEEAEAKKFLVEPGMGNLPDRLFHVTTAKDAVLQEGLKTRSQLSQGLGKGLGGGSSDTVSFTTDIETARGIKAALLEGKSVATKDLSVKDMVQMAEEGTSAKKPWINHWLSYYNRNREQGDPIPEGIENVMNGVRVDTFVMPRTQEEVGEGWEPAGEPWPHGKEYGEKYTKWKRPLTPKELAEDTFEVYKSWSTFREHAGGPLNPLFFLSDPSSLAEVPDDQIAILQFAPKTGAQGHQVSALGEWRSYDGSSLDLIREVE